MMKPMHALIARLVEITGRPALDAELFELFQVGAGDSVLFCGGDPVQHPECIDVAVILPELMAQTPRLRRAGVAAPELEPILQARYGFQRWPTLLFLRDGQYVGAISGVQDWQVYLQKINELLEHGPSRPPSIGIAVTAPATEHCH